MRFDGAGKLSVMPKAIFSSTDGSPGAAAHLSGVGPRPREIGGRFESTSDAPVSFETRPYDTRAR